MRTNSCRAVDRCSDVDGQVMAYLMKKNVTAFLLVDEYRGAKYLCIRLSVNIFHDIKDFKVSYSLTANPSACALVPVCTHARARACTRIRAHARTHACRHRFLCACACACVCECMHSSMCKHTDRTHAHRYRRMYVWMQVLGDLISALKGNYSAGKIIAGVGDARDGHELGHHESKQEQMARAMMDQA